MATSQPTATEIIVKTTVTHTVTYFFMGILAYAFFDYATMYAETSLKFLMRQTTHPLVMAGPLFQPVRGALFGIVFFLLRDTLFGKRNGWHTMWVILLVIGILGTFGPAPGSLEGLIYTVVPVSVQFRGLPEVLLQSLLLSVVLVYWVNRPPKKWLNWVMGILFFFVILLPVLGLLMQ